MPPTKLVTEPWVCLRCAHRATFATGRARRPPPPSQYKARPRPSKVLASRQRPWTQSSKELSKEEPEQKLTLSDALRDTKKEDNSLLSPVYIPEDPTGVLNERHPATHILTNSGIVIQRQLELANVMLGFEQANKYVILDPQGNHIGFMAEQDNSVGTTVARQMLSTHRSFTTHVFDKHEKEVLRFHRPFSWVSSRIGVYDPVEVAVGTHSRSKDMITSNPGSLSAQVNAAHTQTSPLSLSEMRIIGEARQQWAPLRRKYDLYLYDQPAKVRTDLGDRQISSGDLPLSSSQQLQIQRSTNDTSSGDYNQFAYVNEPFLSWDFSLLSADGGKIGSVNRNWGGIGRELFTDTGVYALRMDAADSTLEQSRTDGPTKAPVPYEGGAGMTLDQRAVMLATAVSIDFDYFSRHSGSGGVMGWMPLWFPGAGGEATATGGAVEGAGAVEEGSIIRGTDYSAAKRAGEGAAVGAGSMAGYEAMQRGTGRSGADEPTFAEEFTEEFLDPGDVEQNPNEQKKDNWPDNPWATPGNSGGRGSAGDGEGSSGAGGAADGGGIDAGDIGDSFDL
ncbi:hypothetical protein XPA_009513 [Xanthoria parietina]